MPIPGRHALELHCLELDRWRIAEPFAWEAAAARTEARPAEAHHRSAAGRWLIRRTLSAALGVAPRDIVLETGRSGKPVCAAAAAAGLAFNLSHAGGRAVLALARTAHVGVDLEERRRAPQARRSGGRFFAAEERGLLRSLPADRAERQALAWWVLKEAAVKAMGCSVFDGLQGVRIEVAQHGPVLRHLPDGWAPPCQWSLAVGPLGEKHLLAIALADSRSRTAASIPVFDPIGSDEIQTWRPDLSGWLTES